jgi:hypothetical protein
VQLDGRGFFRLSLWALFLSRLWYPWCSFFHKVEGFAPILYDLDGHIQGANSYMLWKDLRLQCLQGKPNKNGRLRVVGKGRLRYPNRPIHGHRPPGQMQADGVAHSGIR